MQAPSLRASKSGGYDRKVNASLTLLQTNCFRRKKPPALGLAASYTRVLIEWAALAQKWQPRDSSAHSPSPCQKFSENAPVRSLDPSCLVLRSARCHAVTRVAQTRCLVVSWCPSCSLHLLPPSLRLHQTFSTKLTPNFFRGGSSSVSTLNCALTSRILKINSKDAGGGEWC